MLVAQLSDPHIGADWDGDPAPGLAAAVQAANALEPDAVLLTGDLTEHATDEEYATVRELLAPLKAPVHVLPGNHDRRAPLRRAFEALPGSGEEPVQYAVDLGALRVVVLDSTIPGEDGGRLDAAWLDGALAEAPDTPTMVATHHPPLRTGVPAMDALGIPDDERRAFANVLARHRQVQRVVAGHVHRTVAAGLVLAVPSTYRQLRLDLAATELGLSAEPPAIAVHILLDGELSSHVQQLRLPQRA